MRLLPTSLSYSTNTGVDCQLMTSYAWIDPWHVSCTPGEQVSVFAQVGNQLSFDKFWKILADLEVLRGVVSEGDHLEFTVRNRSEKFRVERILLLPFLFLEVFLGEPGFKFDQVYIRDARSSFPLSSEDLLGWETELWDLFA